MSVLTGCGLSIQIKPRLIGSAKTFNMHLQNEVESYGHVVNCSGGYISASMSIKVDEIDSEDMLANMIGSHVVVMDENLVPCWEGIINEISGAVGLRQIRIGPLIDIANRVIGVYNSETTSKQAITAVANDTISQGLYGIWYRAVSCGSTTATNAAQSRSTFLQDNSYPCHTDDIGASTAPAINISCVGYGALLAYPYIKTGTSWTLREKIIDVLALEPNAIFSTNYDLIEANTLSVTKGETQYRGGDAIIKELVGWGGPSSDYDRRIWGIYADRQMIYETAPTSIEYLCYLRQGTLNVMTTSQVLVQPWAVLPGKWAKFGDFLVNAAPDADMRNDLRLTFIEGVTFTAPQGIQISGTRLDRFQQLQARQNMLKGV